MSWYYEKNQAQQGPVEEAELRELFANAAISGDTLIWTQGMKDWSPYSSVFGAQSLASGTEDEQVECPTCDVVVKKSELIPAGERSICPSCREQYAQGLKEGMVDPARSSQIRGTGGMTPNSELRTIARSALSGGWGTAVLVMFLYLFIQQALAFIPFVGGIVQWIIIGPLSIGLVAYFMGINRDEPVEVGSLFQGFSRFGLGFGLYFITNLLAGLSAVAAAIPGIVILATLASSQGGSPQNEGLQVLGVLLAVVPAVAVGIYMYLRYSLVFFLANDDPGAGVFATIRTSVEMMKGRKGKLFFLYLSFIGWHLLGLLALGIGLLWSMSYMWSATAAFYDDLGEEA